jgi:Asp-tRNA(Asn)/Glu-tRNA(Gln) amidotransferase A subunit family amidase
MSTAPQVDRTSSGPDLDLCYLPATEAIEAFKSRTLSPVELMEAVIARSEQVNPTLNAITYTYFDRALEQAREAERVYRDTNAAPRALEGIPTAIKDFHPVEGEITTFGSRLYKDFVADNTAPTVERLLDAGAIMHLRTTTPEFAHSSITRSPLWGATRNPWNPEYTSGGSSGGSGAAVASGMTTVADGTDGGGSIRIPASACGIVGYKPPFGRNPLDREHPFETLLHYGPMTRTVADAALLQNVMSGPHPADACTLRERVTLPLEYESIKDWKVAFTMDYGYFEVDHEVQANTRAAVEAFRELGCQVDEVPFDWDWSILDAWMVHWEGLFAGSSGDLITRQYEMDPFVVKVLERGLAMSAARFYRSNLVRGKMYEKLSPLLDEYRILIAPTLAIPAPPAEARNDNPDFQINGKPVYAYLGWQMTYAYNLIHQLPAISVPSGFSSSGIPTGLHIAARTYDDHTVFQAAAAFETIRPWRDTRPSV